MIEVRSKINEAQRLIAVVGQGVTTVCRSKPSHDHAPSAHPDVHRLAQQRRQEFCNPRLLHPVAQILAIAAADQQGVGLLELGDNFLLQCWAAR